MKTYYVATLARCVLVDARDETEARTLGHDGLRDLYADLRERLGRDIPIEIKTIRLTTDAEIDLWQFHQRMLREEEADQDQSSPFGRRLHPHVDRQTGRESVATTRRDFEARQEAWLPRNPLV